MFFSLDFRTPIRKVNAFQNNHSENIFLLKVLEVFLNLKISFKTFNFENIKKIIFKISVSKNIFDS